MFSLSAPDSIRVGTEKVIKEMWKENKTWKAITFDLMNDENPKFKCVHRLVKEHLKGKEYRSSINAKRKAKNTPVFKPRSTSPSKVQDKIIIDHADDQAESYKEVDRQLAKEASESASVIRKRSHRFTIRLDITDEQVALD